MTRDQRLKKAMELVDKAVTVLENANGESLGYIIEQLRDSLDDMEIESTE